MSQDAKRQLVELLQNAKSEMLRALRFAQQNGAGVRTVRAIEKLCGETEYQQHRIK